MEAYNLFPSFEEENNNKKKRNFEGQELLIGLPLKGISFFGCYSSPLFSFSSQISEGIQQQRLRELPRDCGGGKVSNSIGL